MKSDEVYEDFNVNVRSIRNAFKKDLVDVKKELYDLTDYYLTDRLFVFPKRKFTVDPQYGIPVPYLVFWFADAFHFEDDSIINRLALTLMYAATFYCIRDDLLDGFVRTTDIHNREHAHIALSNFFLSRYLRIFKGMFSENSIFWYSLSTSLDEWWQHEYWNFSTSFLKRENSTGYFISKNFLMQSCKYMTGLTFPSIWGLAIKARREKEFQSIKKFLIYYYLGNRIVDDLRDLEEDLTVKNYNHSSVINHAATYFSDRRQVGLGELRSSFLNSDFTSSIYCTIIKYYSRAKASIEPYNSRYLTQFMNDQIEYFKRKNEYYRKRQKDFVSSALSFLSTSTKQ